MRASSVPWCAKAARGNCRRRGALGFLLVLGGENNPHWGWGAGPPEEHLLTDGALYDAASDRWLPFSVPDGAIVHQGDNLADVPGAAHFSFRWTGKYALTTVQTYTATGGVEARYFLYDPETDHFRELDLENAGSVLITRSGNLLLLDADYGGATFVDAEDLSTRRIELTPPAMLNDTDLTGPEVTAWDGCRFAVWGFAHIEFEQVELGQCPPGFGCDPPPPKATVTQVPGGAMFTFAE